MSATDITPLPTSLSPESVLAHERLANRMDVLEERQEEHIADYKKDRVEILAGISRFNRLASQIRVVAWIVGATFVAAVGGAAYWAGWVIDHKVTDQLLRHDIIRYERTAR